MLRNALVVLVLLGALSVSSFAISGAEYRKMADKAVIEGRYAQAAEYYNNEAAVYRARGDVNGAKAEEIKADRWASEVDIFYESHPSPDVYRSYYSGAKHEPIYGCYLGAFVERDDRIPFQRASDATPLSRATGFMELVGKKPATFFDYCIYGKTYPKKWVDSLVADGVAPHLAYEPHSSLEIINEDDYLVNFAKAAGQTRAPVFIRFAGEMNGDWTRYHSDPVLYRRKFQLVHDVFQKYAPNAAMIWCVNHIPEYNIDQYYPGDKYVDWVGINFYSVIYYDNNRNRPAYQDNPAVFLKYVYNKYAKRKPIAICEYGASHVAALDGANRSELAVEKISQMYASLPRIYPRVKMIDVFDMNNLKHAMPSRQLNNYSVTEDETVLEAFKRAVAPDYFLTDIIPQVDEFPALIKRISPGTRLYGTVNLSAWVKTYDRKPTVTYYLDGKPISRVSQHGTYPCQLQVSRYGPGKHNITVTVQDSKSRLSAKKTVPVVF